MARMTGGEALVQSLYREGVRVVLMKRHDPSHGHSNRLRKTFTRALRKKSEYDAEMDSRGFARDPARTDTAESNEDAGATERSNEDRYEEREEHDQERDVQRHQSFRRSFIRWSPPSERSRPT